MSAKITLPSGPGAGGYKRRIAAPGTRDGFRYGPAPDPWRIDPKAIREACEFLGLEGTIEVKLTSGRRRHGAHRGSERVTLVTFQTDDGESRTTTTKAFRHTLTVSTYRRPESASATLWHELAHTKQFQTLGEVAFRQQYQEESRRHGYDGNRFEVEARQHEELADTHPLVKRSL